LPEVRRAWRRSTRKARAVPRNRQKRARQAKTALFNAWEDAVECAKCGGRMVRTGGYYTSRDCGTNQGCS